MHTTCPSCAAINRIPDDKRNQPGQCGRCKSVLFNGDVVDLTDADFARFVSKNDLPVVVDFWASWCGPCQTCSRSVRPIWNSKHPNPDCVSPRQRDRSFSRGTSCRSASAVDTTSAPQSETIRKKKYNVNLTYHR
jgi:hypothetical protein